MPALTKISIGSEMTESMVYCQLSRGNSICEISLFKDPFHVGCKRARISDNGGGVGRGGPKLGRI